jgi:hypothetical protein
VIFPKTKCIRTVYLYNNLNNRKNHNLLGYESIKYIKERENEANIQLSGMPNTKIQYKFTRGDWNHREQNSKHQDLVGPLQAENRVYDFTTPDEVVEVTIESWSDIK